MRLFAKLIIDKFFSLSPWAKFKKPLFLVRFFRHPICVKFGKASKIYLKSPSLDVSYLKLSPI